MAYYIIYDHALSNPRIATETKPIFKGSDVYCQKAIYFNKIEDARLYLEGNFDCQCAAIVEIIETK